MQAQRTDAETLNLGRMWDRLFEVVPSDVDGLPWGLSVRLGMNIRQRSIFDTIDWINV